MASVLTEGGVVDGDGWEDLPVGGSMAAAPHVLDALERSGLARGNYRYHSCGTLVADMAEAREAHLRECNGRKGAEMPANKNKSGTVSAKQAAVEVLRAEGGPLHLKVLSERILADHKTGLKGKTPAATIAAQLHVAANKGDTFRKVGKGTFDLIDRAETVEPTPSEPEPVEPERQAKPDPKPAQKQRRKREPVAA